MNILRTATAMCTLTFAAAEAQAAPAFIGTSGDFLTSSFCRQTAQCVKVGTANLGQSRTRGTMTEDYFHVTPNAKQPLGQESYTVMVTRFQGKVSRVGLRYLPHQDIPENGDVARTLMAFATGAPFGKQELYGTLCSTYVKNGNRFFIVEPPLRTNLSGVADAVISVSDTPAVSMQGIFAGNGAVQLRRDPACAATGVTH